jgi:hypothetical protein
MPRSAHGGLDVQALSNWRGQFVSSQGQLHRAGSAPSLADALARFVVGRPSEHRAKARAAAASVDSIDDHFLRLFGEYEKLSKRWREKLFDHGAGDLLTDRVREAL